ncbi:MULTISPECIES: helix-turn-helix domain-containing protein [unclassified Streptomyces]|uniref:helix-turn-helix domain-containing protein n=1 Tax=unclassified Streptomyces TaxID=2593676 RepID=UPI0033BA7E3E
MILLDTSELPVDERVEAFRAALLTASVPSLVRMEEGGERAFARMERWHFGELALFTSGSSGWAVSRSPRYLRLEGAPMVSLSLQVRGTGRFGQSGRQERVAPGELMLNDLTIPYDFAWSGRGGAQALQVPYDALGVPPRIVRRGAERLRASPLYDLVRAHIGRLQADADTLAGDPGAAALGSATVELVRALLTSAAGVDAYARPALAESLLQRVLAYARTHLTEPDLTPARIAHAHSISVRALYRLCARAGLSLEQWIIEQRLEGARASLVSPAGRTRTVASVARAWGFTDPSHFTRRFKAAYGVTPRRWRAAQSGPAE